MLVSCSGGASSNTNSGRASSNTNRTQSNENRTVSNVIDGNESTDGGLIQFNGATIGVDSDGNPSILDDPSGNAEVARNSDGSFTVNGLGGSATFSSDGSIINRSNSNP